MRRRAASRRTPPRWTAPDLRAAVAGLRGTVVFNAPLRDYTSFRIGGQELPGLAALPAKDA